MTREQALERIIQVSPPFDKRTNDLETNYGIGAMQLRFILKGANGATQFVFYNGMGEDIGYHSYTPQYEGQTVMRKTCDILGCACYYDGSSLLCGGCLKNAITLGSRRKTNDPRAEA